MAFDLSTARPVDAADNRKGKFDLSTAKPVSQEPENAAPQSESFLKNARDVAGEFAASANRTAVGALDFIGPDTVNAGLRLAGSDYQVPTLRETLKPTGIEGGFMDQGLARDAIQAGGALLTSAGGMMQVPRNVATAGGALAEMAGIGTAKTTPAMATKLALLRDTGDVSTAGVMLDQAGNVVKDKTAKAAMWQGFDPGFVAMVKSSTKDTKQKMSAMLDIVEQGKQNYRFRADNRPLNVLGDSVLNRIKVVREANRDAARRLEGVADSLRGVHVDATPAVDNFVDTLTQMGMKYDRQSKTLELIQGSATQDMPKVHKEAARILKRLQTTRTPGQLDAYDVHVMKKWIDNNVDYAKNGKGKSGMIGQLEGAIKGLRHDLDGLLDDTFPEYNRVNTKFSETRQALDEVRDIAGKRFNPDADSAALTMGSLSRRFLSNAQSNGYLRDAVSNLDTVARKYIDPGTDLVPFKPGTVRRTVTPAMLENDGLLDMASFADEMDKMFGAASGTSLLGDIEKGVNTASGGFGAMAIDGAKFAAKKAARINEDRAIKSMRELLNK